MSRIYAHGHIHRPVRGSTSPGWAAAGLLVTLALLTAACGESTPNVMGPELLRSQQGQGSPAEVSEFAVLANEAVTCTDGSTAGDVGTFLPPPDGSFIDTNCEVDGSIHLGDGLAVQAYEDFLAEYDALADEACDEVLTGTLDGVTLSPGVYCFEAAATLTDSHFVGNVLSGAAITLTRGSLEGNAWAGAGC